MTELRQARPNKTIYAADVWRPGTDRVKIGDTFITEDGTSYYMDHTGIFMPDGKTEIAGVGLPIATDLGRMEKINGKLQAVTGDHYAPLLYTGLGVCGSSYGAGVQSSRYIVAPSGEGHWDIEWARILNALEPKQDGKQGEKDPTGYFIYDEDCGWMNTIGL